MFKKFLMFMWLFPMNIIGILNSGKYIGTYKDVKIYRWKWWMKGFATAWGDRILFDKKHEDLFLLEPTYSEKLLVHEYTHIKQQREHGAILFLLIYCGNFISNFLFKSYSRFNWYLSYKQIWFEQQARFEEIKYEKFK